LIREPYFVQMNHNRRMAAIMIIHNAVLIILVLPPTGR